MDNVRKEVEDRIIQMQRDIDFTLQLLALSIDRKEHDACNWLKLMETTQNKELFFLEGLLESIKECNN